MSKLSSLHRLFSPSSSWLYSMLLLFLLLLLLLLMCFELSQFPTSLSMEVKADRPLPIDCLTSSCPCACAGDGLSGLAEDTAWGRPREEAKFGEKTGCERESGK